MPRRYVPVLRTKAGEATALNRLSPAAASRTLPLVRMTPAPAARFLPVVLSGWSGRPFALSGTNNFQVNGSTAAFTAMFNALGNGGVSVMPSVPIDAPAPYVTAVSRVVGRFHPGLVVVTDLDQLPNAAAWVSQQGWQPSDVDLVLWLGDIIGYSATVLAPVVETAISGAVGRSSPWRSFAMAASSAPKDYSGLPAGRTDVARREWALWQAVSARLRFPLDYGDSGTVHPSMEEPPGVAMARASVSIRYAIDDHWIVIKGTAVGGARGAPMGQQYRRHARVLTADANFGGVANCWADGQISQIAGGTASAGSRQTWVGLSLNRHISLVADRLP